MSGVLTIRGMAELQDKLQALPHNIATKVLGSAMAKAFKPVLDDARAMVPVDSGALRDSLRIAVKRGRAGEPMRVGIRIGGGNLQRQAAMAQAVFGGDELPPARRWHFIELGTDDLAPHPFLRPALDKNKSAVLAILKDEIAEGLSKMYQRAAVAQAVFGG